MRYLTDVKGPNKFVLDKKTNEFAKMGVMHGRKTKIRNQLKEKKKLKRNLPMSMRNHEIDSPVISYVSPEGQMVAWICEQRRRYVVAKQCECTTSLLPCTASCTACIFEFKKIVNKQQVDYRYAIAIIVLICYVFNMLCFNMLTY